MSNLYELMGEYRALEEASYAEGIGPGQVEAFLDKIDEAKGPLREKVDNIVRLLRNLGGDATKLKKEEDRLAKRRKALEAMQEKLRHWIQTSMDVLDVKEIKTPLASISLSTKVPVTVTCTDIKLVPEEYLKAPAVDLAKVKKAYVDNGEVVPGCQVQEGSRWVVIR